MREETCQPDTPLYNSRIVLSYIKFLRHAYSHLDVKDIMSFAGIEPYQVEDEDHWFTQEQIDRFHERLEELTGNKHIAKEAGRFFGSSDGYGILKSYALGFIGPASTCEIIAKVSPNMVRSCTYAAKRIGPDKVKITVTPKPGTAEKPFQCENRMGYFESLGVLFNRKLLSIEHPECVFKGDATCSYVMTWRLFRADSWKKARNYAAAALAAASFAMLHLYPGVGLVLLLFSVLATFALSAKAWKVHSRELYAAIDSLSSSTDALLAKTKANNNHARMVQEIWLVLSSERGKKNLLEKVAQVLEQRLDYDRGMILLADKEKRRLICQASFGYSDALLPVLHGESFSLREGSEALFSVAFFSKKPFLINGLENIQQSMSRHSLEFATRLRARSFLCCPILCGEEAIGILAVDNVETRRPLLQNDIDQLMEISPAIGVTIKNAFITESKEKQFNSILEALASSIDARDTLTAGHSERVTRFAVGIAEELGLSKDYCEMIRVASLLHDYGKIGIPDSILKKAGKLTPEEFAEIKTHATKTKDILAKIEFEGTYREVPDIAASHHEKFDGTGYPKGLKGEEIPMGARILAVADVFEAVTSKRHYRDPMALEEALGILREGKGRHFDPTIVEAFLRYYQGEARMLDALPDPAEEKADQYVAALPLPLKDDIGSPKVKNILVR